MRPKRFSFETSQQLAEALAEALAAGLKAALATRGAASLAVSGGTTPARLFNTLAARADVPWDKVVVTLVDERWVEESSERSNARLVKANLLRDYAATAVFVPLYQGGAEPDAAALAVADAAQARIPLPFDAVILGMGNDGHTASFFPAGDTLHQALTAEGPLIAIRAAGAGETRVTQTLQRLLKSRALYLHIEGEEKAETLERAEADGPIEAMPIRAILRQTQTPLTIYWCP